MGEKTCQENQNIRVPGQAVLNLWSLAAATVRSMRRREIGSTNATNEIRIPRNATVGAGGESVTDILRSILFVRCASQKEKLWKQPKFITNFLWLKEEPMMQLTCRLCANPVTIKFMPGGGTGGVGSESINSRKRDMDVRYVRE